jgi:hypothetical protein
VNRLCSGPHPLPPPDQPDPDTDTAPTWPLTATERSCVVATGSLDTLGSLRTDGLVDHLPAAGVTATLAPLHRGRTARVGRGADLVVLAGSHDGRAATELVEARRAAGRATVVDIVPSDLVCSPDDTATLTPRAARLVTACGMASAPNGAAQTALRALGVRAHSLPTVLTRARAAELKSARSAPATAPELVIGWIPGWADALRPHYLDPVAEGLTKLLADRVDVRLEVGGTDSDMPDVLRAHDRVTILGSAPEPPQLGRWSIHVWTPPMIGGAVADDQRSFAEASYAGVPTVFPARALDAIDGYVSPDVLVAHVKESEEWAATLRALVDDDAGRSKRAAEAVRRSNTVDGPAAAKAAVRRFFSWALYDRAQ